MTTLGFSGSRDGLTPIQRSRLAFLIAAICPDEAHHGDCKGADAAFHDIVREYAPDCRIVIHPPETDVLQANCRGDETRPVKGYLDRNADIVAETEKLVACPRDLERVDFRSGTWATIRMARKAGKSFIVILPDGSLLREGKAQAGKGEG